MDRESLTLIINGFNKQKFEETVRVVLNNIINEDASNIETLSLQKGVRKSLSSPSVYFNITEKGGMFDDALFKKKLSVYRIENIYFFYKYNLSDAELRKLDIQYKARFGINTTCLCSGTLAEFLIDSGLVDKLFEGELYNRTIISTDVDYLTAAFHSLTIASSDVRDLKGKVYDDAILFKVASAKFESIEDLSTSVIQLLNLQEDKYDTIYKRCNALLQSGMFHKENSVFVPLPSVLNDIESRKKAYIYELDSLTAAQVDLMRNDYKVDWTEQDAKEVAILLAFSAIYSHIGVLRDIKSNIDHPIFRMAKDSDKKIINYLIDKKKFDNDIAQEALHNLADIAATHPLIIKITRACIYLALEGSNPLSSAHALGAEKWKDFKVMLEPTVAIPYICFLLYNAKIKSYKSSIDSVQRALSLTSNVSIPYSYINECAGHLLAARKYDGLNLDADEMTHSNNAFVSNYYSMLKLGIEMPASFMEYLATFSPAIKTEKLNIKNWVREIMTDLTSILKGGHVSHESIPFYQEEDLKDFSVEYQNVLSEKNKVKPSHLINHDSIALKYTNDKVAIDNEHWIILSYDSILTTVGNNSFYRGWICSPGKFLELTNITRPLSETEMVSVLHSVATFSEKTLAIGAKIMDRIIQYASNEMQNWQFKQDLEKFKSEMKVTLSSTFEENMFDQELITRTDGFLKERGINIHEDELEVTLDNLQ